MVIQIKTVSYKKESYMVIRFWRYLFKNNVVLDGKKYFHPIEKQFCLERNVEFAGNFLLVPFLN